MLALSTRALTKTYKNGVQALRGVDLDVEQGDFFALLGPNGAGKTTLIGIVTSLVNKTGGSAGVFGYDIDRELERAKSLHRRGAAGTQFQSVRDAADHRGQPGRLLRRTARRGAACAPSAISSSCSSGTSAMARRAGCRAA